MILRPIRYLISRFRYSKLQSRILEMRPERGVTLTLVNEERRQYTVVALPVGWQVADRKPFDLQQERYVFLSKWQAGICPRGG